MNLKSIKHKKTVMALVAVCSTGLYWYLVVFYSGYWEADNSSNQVLLRSEAVFWQTVDRFLPIVGYIISLFTEIFLQVVLCFILCLKMGRDKKDKLKLLVIGIVCSAVTSKTIGFVMIALIVGRMSGQ